MARFFYYQTHETPKETFFDPAQGGMRKRTGSLAAILNEKAFLYTLVTDTPLPPGLEDKYHLTATEADGETAAPLVVEKDYPFSSPVTPHTFSFFHRHGIDYIDSTNDQRATLLLAYLEAENFDEIVVPAWKKNQPAL